jgi:hypothetical protein
MFVRGPAGAVLALTCGGTFEVDPSGLPPTGVNETRTEARQVGRAASLVPLAALWSCLCGRWPLGNALTGPVTRFKLAV